MFAGHFGLAAIVKAKAPEVPLWALMVSTQLLDIAFVPLLLSGAETMEPIGHGGYGQNIIHADYTHSLIGALVLSLLAGLLAWLLWNKRSAVIIGSLSFSHWLFDLIFHHSDMPILPGNIGDFPLLGLRLWELPALSAAVEIVLIAAGALLYFRSVLARSRRQAETPANGNLTLKQNRNSPVRAYWAGAIMTALLILSFATDYFNL
ncbi:hypothetical protein SAMN04487969_12346 [Paenibacillus algorifonticola]|uniref:LexA-binding, inner membrane-associated hydrolase n=1 Tax=Paenibacillus algorifonticola TaxID=684063 RepID=A0A1I2HFE7_9BACL|nr:hypothetical protein [Paenibacillus algorifonticola]SFF28894.1 hypothetical protein SAMN04487969_12346 [Paenibacillus algorifonticola]